MICPRCREENAEDSKVCTSCGLKLKISCPRCKNLNPVGQEICSTCKLKLIAFCPECKAPNYPTAKVCRKCGNKLLVECPNCKVLNPANRTKCLKCSFDLEKKDIPKQVNQQTKVQSPIQENPEQKPETAIKKAPELKLPKLEEYAVLSVEFINLSAVRAKLKSTEIEKKLRKYFLHIINLTAKKFKEEYLVLSDQTAAIEFKCQNSTRNSALYSLVAARDILREINELNYKIQKTLKVKVRIKIGISTVNSQTGKYYSKVERSVATAENIVVNSRVQDLASDKFDFEMVGSVPVDDKLITVYKLTDPLGQHSTPEIIIEEPGLVSQNEEITEETEHDKTEEEIGEDLSDKRESSQNNITGYIIKTLTTEKSNAGHVIGISAPDGAGKTTIVSTAKQLLEGRKIKFLTGQCQPINEIIPFAYFQDLLKNLFGLPPFIINIEESKKVISQILLELNLKDKYIEESLFNLLFSENMPNSTDIVKNQKKIFESIKAVFVALKTENTIALVIEDFEFIDPSSFECIKYLIDTGFLDSKSQIIITHTPDINIKDYLYLKDNDDQLVDVHLKPLQKEEAEKVILGMLSNQDLLPQKLKDVIYKNSKGMPVYIEQVLWLLFESGVIRNDNNVLKFNPDAANFMLPETVEEIIKIRLTRFNKISAIIPKILLNACMFGQKFMPNLLKTTTEIDDQQFMDSMHMLESSGIFIQYDRYSLIFKNRILYNLIYNEGFVQGEKANYHAVTLRVLNNFTKISSAILAAHAELANLPDEAANYWHIASKEALLLGDVKSYITAQHRFLSLLDKLSIPEKDKAKLNVYEEAGKINYEIAPEEAIPYLSNAIMEREKKDDIVKIIELTGYLARSSELTGNYAGVIECADKALSKINQENSPLEYALLNYCKLESIYNSGKIEEAIYLAKNDILPALKTAISKNKSIPGLSTDELNYIEIETSLILAKSFAAQGNKEAVIISNSLVYKAKELGIKKIEVQAKLVEALYKALQGEKKSVNVILEYLKPLISQMTDNNIKLYWGFIKLLTDILSGNFDAAKSIISSIIVIAEENRDYNILALTKLFEGKTYKEEHDLENAKTLYNDVLVYCSERKLALGALLGWYLYAEAEITDSNVEKAQEISEKALEIAQRPGININFFSMLLQRQLGEIQIIKGDFEAARMYIEQAVTMAKSLDLYLLLSKLLLTYGKIFQEMAAISGDDKQSNANSAHEYFMKSLDIAQELENEHMILQIEKEFTSLSTFCQLSGIVL